MSLFFIVFSKFSFLSNHAETETMLIPIFTLMIEPTNGPYFQRAGVVVGHYDVNISSVDGNLLRNGKICVVMKSKEQPPADFRDDEDSSSCYVFMSGYHQSQKCITAQ